MDVHTMFSSVLKEYAYWIDESWVTGTIPPELCGTYYRNGPGLTVTNPRYSRHVLDGDGMVFSLAFVGGRAYFRNRFVRTEGFVKEQAAGRPLLRNSFTRGSVDGTSAFNPFDLRFKNVANTGVLPWAGQLYALWEAGLPHLMDPVTLDTVRLTRMGGQVRGDNLAGHYRITHGEPPCVPLRRRAVGDAGAQPLTATACGEGGCRRLVTFSNNFGFSGANAIFYEFDEEGRLLHESEFALPGVSLAVIHDMVVTEHYYGIVVGPMKLDAAKFATQYMLGRCSIAECLVFDRSQRSRIMLFPRPGRPSGKALAPRVLEAEPFFVFHHVNAFEAADGEQVVIDCVAWDEVSFTLDLYDRESRRLDGFVGGARTQLTRLTCDLRSGRVARRKLVQRTVEFPSVDPRVTGRPHSVAWSIADVVDDPVLWGPAQSIVRVSMDPTLGLAPPAAAALQREREQRGADSPVCGEAAPRVSGPAAGATFPLAPPLPPAAAADGGAAGRVSVEAWRLGERVFPGEPMFVPRPGSAREGEGWVIVAVHDAAAAERGRVLIFDAERISAGPLATIRLPHRLPVSLHGAWSAEYTGPDPADPGVPQWQELGCVRPL